ncbi:MAG TPA: dihydroorotate dehydrogenase electron transfer subunit [Methanothermobacter sp.]|uniref:Dihydroorotate dehydrogenase electron transfer subunit n=1 Tax=Methanothermobacter tenebrarum TaxID=680118 RepID=A0ABM7YBW0_9EURY|nr:dihydroorotate dehydrogenase electron transfer subunit [Methanothermobacter tenebrarum]MDD3454043.1 dihydroorotate dehydrogenase electron transfer subunit [Methanobacteriales archaeon]MDI6882326.1 dihydroorotate dehydrogenase electron transfer subunit [Methanothermobacter sp.]MDX9693589.1 dihydroorotate dehydrogenase electron transfer subunit [Methanothermobacter sp.]BDH78837.1 dihydroorotate dehydrogenase electron transfer subunit [Methanothermobacter tenebrarum]HHW17045.1 dihydroorotate d
MHVPKILEIKRIIRESSDVKTLICPWDGKSPVPGQFMMIWDFKDEKPMSVSLIDKTNNEIGISIRKVGPFTSRIHKLREGDKLGLRGPYGRGFTIEGHRILAIGGGVGMAPIAALVEEARARDFEVDVIVAARTYDELLFLDRLEKTGARIFTCTDDGSCGFKGFAIDRLKTLKETYDMAMVCGPEAMMKGIFLELEKRGIPGQFSLERYIKCAMGLCGHCCLDNTGWRVCVEGPVFWSHELKMVKEFGEYKRDATGAIRPLG